LAQLSQDNRLFVLRDHHLPTFLPARNLHRSICNATKLALSLCPLFPHGSEERATMRLFIHFLPQLLHAAGLRHQDVEYCCASFVQGKWRQLWDMAMAGAEKLEDKQAKNPTIARSRSFKEKSQYAHRCATVGNLSKACKIVCKEQIPACNDDTVQKLQDLHPTRSLDLNLDKLPPLASRQQFWDGEEGLIIKRKWISVSKARKYFRTRPALGAADIDGWRGRKHVRYLFQNNELHEMIIDELIFPYVLGELIPQFLPELAGGLLFAFLKKDGGIRPLSCGSIWRRCAARLVNDYTRNAAHRYFTTTYPNFMQCAGGLEDGATRCAQLLNMLHDLPREDQDLDDPAAFIDTDIRDAFQEMCRQTSFDTLMGVATQTYDGGRVQPGDTIPIINELEPFLGYFWAMHSTECTNRFTDHCGRTHHVTGTTGGQQGDGMEMGRYSLSQHPIWGRVLARHRRARGIAFADDSYIHGALKSALQVLVDIRQRLWEDAKL
jgi:hypothetical protein